MDVDVVHPDESKNEKGDEDQEISSDISKTVPSEIWVKILSHLNQKELVRARTVCSTWCNVVDEHFQFSVIVHDDKTDLKRVYQLRIKDCLITKLLGNHNILQYPDLLRRVRLWGPINAKNIQRILLQATKLEELSMTRCSISNPGIFQKTDVFVFENLLKLKLLGYCCKDAGIEVSMNIIRLLSHEMPALQKILINVTCLWKQMDTVIVSLFGFLARHRKKIKDVNASLIPAAGGHESISHLPTPIPQGIKDLLYDKELQLESLRLSIASKYVSSWAPVLSSQTKLVNLRVHWASSNEPPHPHVSGIPSSIIVPALIHSAATLVQVDLRDLNLTVDVGRGVIPFDASIFRCAENLRKLVLVRNNDDCQRNTEPFGSETIINVDAIPSSIEDLEIVRLRCRSSELQTLVDAAASLKSVKLQHTGTSGGKGVNGGIIRSITRKKNIKIMNICPISYHDPEENKKLDALKLAFEGICSGDHIYYDFERFRQGIPQPNKRHHHHRETPASLSREAAAAEANLGALGRADFLDYRFFRRNWNVHQVVQNVRAINNPRPGPSQMHGLRSRLSRHLCILPSRPSVNMRSISAGPPDRHQVTPPVAPGPPRNRRLRRRRCSSADDLIRFFPN